MTKLRITAAAAERLSAFLSVAMPAPTPALKPDQDGTTHEVEVDEQTVHMLARFHGDPSEAIMIITEARAQRVRDIQEGLERLRQADIREMQHPGEWLTFPILPLKRTVYGGAQQAGFMFADGSATVYVADPASLSALAGDKPWCEALAMLERLEYDDFDELTEQASGWSVNVDDEQWRRCLSHLERQR